MNEQVVADSLRVLGAAYRDDWSNFDGRTLREQLGELADALESTEPFSFENFCLGSWICPSQGCWPEHCSTAEGYSCEHMAPLHGDEEQ